MNPSGYAGAAVQAGRQSPYRFVIAALLLTAHLSIGLNLFSVSPILLDIIRDYGINRSTAGLLVALPLLIAAAFGLPGGIFAVRLGFKRAFATGWWLIALISLSAVAPNFHSLLALRLLFGLGVALLLTATGPLLMQWFRPREVLVMNGLDTAMLSLGIAVSVTTAAPLAGSLEWANALGVFGAGAALGAFAWTVLGRAQDDPGLVVTAISIKELRLVLGSRTVLLLLAADAGVLIQYTALTGWLPTFYTEERGMTPAEAGFTTGILPFVGVFAVLLGTFLPLRFGSPKSFLILPGVLAGLGGLGAFTFGNTTGIHIALILVGIGSWLYVPTLLSLCIETAGPSSRNVALVWGSLITVSGLGMFFSPIGVGFLRDLSGSFLPGFLICALPAWALLLAGVFIPGSTADRGGPRTDGMNRSQAARVAG